MIFPFNVVEYKYDQYHSKFMGAEYVAGFFSVH